MDRLSIRAHVMRACIRIVVKRSVGADPAIELLRRRLAFMCRLVPRPPRGTETITLNAGGVQAHRIATQSSRDDRYVLYLHGGAYVSGSPALYRDLTWRLATICRARVLCLDYRL